MGLILPTALSGPRTVPLAFKCRGVEGLPGFVGLRIAGPSYAEGMGVHPEACLVQACGLSRRERNAFSPGLIRWTVRRWLGKVAGKNDHRRRIPAIAPDRGTRRLRRCREMTCRTID